MFLALVLLTFNPQKHILFRFWNLPLVHLVGCVDIELSLADTSTVAIASAGHGGGFEVLKRLIQS